MWRSIEPSELQPVLSDGRIAPPDRTRPWRSKRPTVCAARLPPLTRRAPEAQVESLQDLVDPWEPLCSARGAKAPWDGRRLGGPPTHGEELPGTGREAPKLGAQAGRLSAPSSAGGGGQPPPPPPPLPTLAQPSHGGCNTDAREWAKPAVSLGGVVPLLPMRGALADVLAARQGAITEESIAASEEEVLAARVRLLGQRLQEQQRSLEDQARMARRLQEALGLEETSTCFSPSRSPRPGAESDLTAAPLALGQGGPQRQRLHARRKEIAEAQRRAVVAELAAAREERVAVAVDITACRDALATLEPRVQELRQQLRERRVDAAVKKIGLRPPSAAGTVEDEDASLELGDLCVLLVEEDDRVDLGLD